MCCEHCGSEMAFAFYHKDYRVWWCRFCAELFLEDGGQQYLLNPGQVSEMRLPEHRAE
jgi:hypothetical protein